MPCPSVPCLGPVVSSQEERPPCRHQDAQQVHQIWSQVSLRLLYAHQDRKQTAGRDGGRVSRAHLSVTHKDIWTPLISVLYLLSHDSPLFDFIESCLRNKNEMVVYEAASAIVHMPNCTARELAPAVSGQCLHLTHF